MIHDEATEPPPRTGVAAQTGVRVLWSDGVVHPGLLEGVC